MNHRRTQYNQAITEPPTCPYCGATARWEHASIIYGPRYHNQGVWVCGNFPTCDSYVGCHFKTKMPLGTLANSDLRIARNGAHRAFDPLWQPNGKRPVHMKRLARDHAYQLLAKYLGKKPKNTHIGLFNQDECAKVIQFVESIYATYPHQNVVETPPLS